MPDQISRRTVLAAVSLAGAAAAQTPTPATEDKLQKATAEVKDSSAKLAQLSIPMDLEPATTFHV